MILATYMEYCDSRRTGVNHYCKDQQGNVIATGVVGFNNDVRLRLSFNGKEYTFHKHLTKVDKPVYSFAYPFCPQTKKAFATEITSEGRTVMQVYREAATYKKVWFLKNNFVFNVYKYNGNVYHCYKVGFPTTDTHYYCLKNLQGDTIAILNRQTWTEDDRRGTLYLKDPSLLELVLLVAGFETMMVQLDISNYNRVHDASAGNYISLSEAEKAMYDPDFIPAVKALDRIID